MKVALNTSVLLQITAITLFLGSAFSRPIRFQQYDSQQSQQELGIIFQQLMNNNGYTLPEFGLFQKCILTYGDSEYQTYFFAPVPLTGIEVKADLISMLLTMQLTQHYQNIEENPVEIQYVFPVYYKSVIYNLTIETSDGQIIVAKVKETKQADQEYKEAIEQGNTAYLAQQDSDSAQDKVVLKIGNLQPQANVIVHFQFAMAIEPSVDSFGRIFLPADLTPKFPIEQVAQVAEELNLQSATYFPIVDQVPYNIDFILNISSTTPIQEIYSPTHDIIIQYLDSDKKHVLITLNPEIEYTPDRDFVILYQNSDYNKPQVLIAEEAGNYVSAMLIFYPYIPLSDDTNYAEQEFILILDRSGSMDGNRIDLAKQTAQAFVQEIPEGSYFNIISFGNSFEFMWSESRQKNSINQNEAINAIEMFEADLGGTDILQPFEEIYQQHADYPRTIFLITDGAVLNPDPVIKLIKENTDSQGIRVHTFGIGQGVSTELVQGAADAGKGMAYFVQGNEPLDQYMLEALEVSMVPYLSDIEIKWEMTSQDGQIYGTDHENENFMQSPEEIKYIISQQIVIMYVLVLDANFLSGSFYFSYKNDDQIYKLTIALNQSQLINYTSISKLAAKNLIQDLNVHQEENEEMIIYLSEKFNVLSPLTSFMKFRLSRILQMVSMKTVEVPITQIYDSYAGGELNDAMAMGYADGSSDMETAEGMNVQTLLIILVCLLPVMFHELKIRNLW